MESDKEKLLKLLNQAMEIIKDIAPYHGLFVRQSVAELKSEYEELTKQSK